MATTKRVLTNIAYIAVLVILAYVIFTQLSFQDIEVLSKETVAGTLPEVPATDTPLTLMAPNLRWNHMPLTIRVDMRDAPPRFRDYHRSALAEAARVFDERTDGLVSFRLVEGPADITVRWTEDLPSDARDAVGHTVVSWLRGESANLITDATVSLLVSRAGRPLSYDDMFNTALHELGHALGLNHTSDRTSIMFPQVTGTTDLNMADSETLVSIYSVTPSPELYLPEASFSVSVEKRGFFTQHYLSGNVTVKNSGMLPAPSFTLTILADGSQILEEPIAGLGFEETLSFRFENYAVPDTVSVVSARVDSEDEVEEMDETNNEAAVSIR